MELFNEDTSAKGCSSGFGFVDGVWVFLGGGVGVCIEQKQYVISDEMIGSLDSLPCSCDEG